MFKWMFLPLKRYAEFSGRSRRKEFWLWTLFAQGLSLILMAPLISVVIEVVSAIPEGVSEEELEGLIEGLILDSLESVNPALILSAMGLLILLTLAFLVPNLALILRRFLDANIEAKWFWILLVASVVPFFFGLPALAIWIIAGFVPGTPGPNKFGDDPRDGVTRLPPDEPVPPPPQIWPAS